MKQNVEQAASVTQASSNIQKHFSSGSFETVYLEMIESVLNNPEFESSPRGKKTLETMNMSFELTNPYDRIVWNPSRSANYIFAMKFFAWMINGSDDFSYLYESNKNAINFADTSDKSGLPKSFSTAYGPRIKRQMPAIIKELSEDKDSRRATINILSEDDKQILGTDTKTEFPCTTALTFSIRNNKLHLHVAMRSNNIVKTIVYDVFNFTMLQEFVLKSLKSSYPGLSMGSYHQNMVSAHIYEDDLGLVTDIFQNPGVNILMKK